MRKFLGGFVVVYLIVLFGFNNPVSNSGLFEYPLYLEHVKPCKPRDCPTFYVDYEPIYVMARNGQYYWIIPSIESVGPVDTTNIGHFQNRHVFLDDQIGT